MKHSNTRITAYHYLESFEALQIDKYRELTPENILRIGNKQTRLMDFDINL